MIRILLCLIILSCSVQTAQMAVRDTSNNCIDTTSNTLIDTIPDLEFHYRILIVGHSWAVGAFKQLDGYSDESFEIKVVAKIGSSIGWTDNVISNLDSGDYDKIVILTGINDCWGSLKSWERSFEKLIETAKHKTADVYLFNVPNYGKVSQKVVQINEWLDSQDGITIIPIYEEYSGVALHPSSYGFVTELFWKYLEK